LIILESQSPRPKITVHDRVKWLFSARFLPNWSNLLRLVQPETRLRWPRELLKSFWEKKSGIHPHPKRISEEMMALIGPMAEENQLWGAQRIRGTP
jgi:putative transposase